MGNVDRYRCRPLLIVDERRRARVEGSEGTQAVMRRDLETECIIIFPRRTHMARLQPTRTSYRIIFTFTGSAMRGTHTETRRKGDPHKAHSWAQYLFAWKSTRMSNIHVVIDKR